MTKFVCQPVNDYIKKQVENGGREIDMFSNFAHLTNNTKILVLDSIIDHAKDVFGPYSGVYGETIFDFNNLAEGEFVAENCNYVKTSDGASFFSRINFGTRYGVTILKSIQQQTKYLSGFSDNTSRDGTTSLAMMGALTAKNFLIYDDTHKVEIPKNIRALIKDVLGYTATSMMKKEVIQVYNPEKREYVKDENLDGFEWTLNAVNTTVGNTPGFREAFGSVMKDAVEKGFDITSTYVQKPERRIGNYKIDIEVEAGIKMKISALTQTKIEPFKDNIGHIFILSGFIADHNAKLFKNMFTEWIKNICKATDENGGLIYSKYNKNYKGFPLILVSRVPNSLEDFYKEITLNGFTFSVNAGGKNVQETIRPMIMLAHDIDVGKLYYQDCTDVYSEIVVDLNAINAKMNSLRSIPLEMNENGVIPSTVLEPGKTREVFIMLPVINGGKVYLDRCEYAYNEDIADKEVGEKHSFVYDESKFKLRTSFDGNTFLMSSDDEELVERMKLKRESLFNMKKNMSDTAGFDNNIDNRINYMSGISLKPVIYVRTEDEFHNIVNLLDDALGVFISVHVHGIMPGANSWILKRITDLRENTFKEANRVISKVVQNKDLLERYVSYAIDCIDMMYNAYALAYNYIDRENAGERLEAYRTGKVPFNAVYNVITGVYDQSILEAARTTSDVFIGSLYVGFDIVDLKRIRVTNYNEWLEVTNKNKENNYHKLNADIVKGEDK